MRHRKRTIKLGRTGAHRDALLASLVCNLIRDGKSITTTLPKAKAASQLAEKMVTLGKKGTLAARRRAISKLRQTEPVGDLFESIAPKFLERSGGYTRITKLGQRRSDGSEMAILEWVDEPLTRKAKKKPAKAAAPKKAPAKEKAPESTEDGPDASEDEGEAASEDETDAGATEESDEGTSA